jgi:O-antigen chain-terminating methyltransferase
MSAQGVRATTTPDVPTSATVEADTFRPLDTYKYVGFEDQFRGSREDIRARLEGYLPIFAGTTDVLDVGCGRGEFLELLGAAGVPARGIDSNHEMAEICRARGLDVTEADAVGYLSGLPDASLGGIFAAQVVEHLQPGYLLQFLELAFHKLRPGGRLVLETLNPACWIAFFDSYIRDITHVWPLHPETLKYLVLASGFTRADLEYRSPVAPEDRLQPIALRDTSNPQLSDIAEAFNANAEKLNARLFTYRDYAVIGGR